MTTAMLKILVLDPDPDHPTLTLIAQYNPKEIQVDHTVPWKPQDKGGPCDLEFTARDPQTLSLELMFDGFEGGTDVMPSVHALRKLTEARTKEKRPPKVMILWGDGARAMPKFSGVVEKVSVKYQMFGTDGAVLRATANVSLKEANLERVGRAKKR
jgi:hypothetical protein